ncbi:hypothetical protein [Chromobacterium violaceum]|uniref:Uncharacterized protein n=1 Tax=Chromobacterium violaceum TaxID=536 RepID=A0A202B2L7_CHRVL|nr:hypothetical protein [Chromobacterium violaceum]OVE45696.1 hypothetical protein CBW21_22145 [Chromobacterium violaceum]
MNAITEQLEQIAGDRMLEKEGTAFASEFLLGELIKAATKQLKELALPWRSMSQLEQENVLAKVKDDCWQAASKAVICVAADTASTSALRSRASSFWKMARSSRAASAWPLRRDG